MENLQARSIGGRLMLKDISARLAMTIQQRRQKQKLEQDLQAVDASLQAESARLASLQEQLNKEKVDVEKLESTSLTALFYSVLGSRDQQLEKERQELLSVQLLYQKSSRQVEFLERDREYLIKQLAELAGVEAQYTSLLAEKELVLRQSNPAAAHELLALSEQTGSLNAEIKEIGEAILAGKQLSGSLDQVIDSLESAKNWGTWDLLGGDLVATLVKHSRIDDARDGIEEVQAGMTRLTRELADIQDQVDLGIDITGFESFADFFLDGLIIDWIVQSKIVDSLERTQEASDSLSQVVKKLDALHAAVQHELAGLQAEYTQIVESS